MNDFVSRVLTARAGKTHIFSVGQAGYIIKSASGELLGIDLYLSDCVERNNASIGIGYKRLLPRLFDPSELPFDVIVTTHPHDDHFDPDTVPHLMSCKRTQLYGSVDCEALADRLMLKKHNMHFMKPGDHAVCGDFTIDFINCDHGTGAPDAFGVIIEVDGKKILETGDTCLRLDRVPEYTAFGKLDVMIAPINGSYGNMNEEDCAVLAEAVKPELTIPCHYGMFAIQGGNPGLFYRLMKEKQLPFYLMTYGEDFEL